MHFALKKREHLRENNDEKDEQDKKEEKESKENTKSEATITELTAVREVVALKLLKLQTSTSTGSERGRGRGTVCRGHDLQKTNTGKDEREVRKNPGINRRQETIFLGKIFAVNLTEYKKTTAVTNIEKTLRHYLGSYLLHGSYASTYILRSDR